MLFAEEAFLGHDLLTWLVLALGAAMLAGNVAALMRPPQQRNGASVREAPRGRSIAYIVLGALITTWALATLLSRG